MIKGLYTRYSKMCHGYNPSLFVLIQHFKDTDNKKLLDVRGVINYIGYMIMTG